MPEKKDPPSPATSADVNATLASRMKQFLDDVVTLDLVTLSGNITLTAADVSKPPADRPDDALDWDKLLAKITAGMKADEASKLEVIAFTHAEWDCDSINYVKANATDKELELIANHTKAVEAAHRSRFEALQFIGKALGSLTK